MSEYLGYLTLNKTVSVLFDSEKNNRKDVQIYLASI